MASERARRSPATIQDVAELAGVSRAAVSKVIRNAYGVSDEMRTRVSAAIDALGYRPSVTARSLRGSSFTIGVEMPSLANQFLNTIVEGITHQLDGSGYRLIIAPSTPGGTEGRGEIEALIDRQVDGLIAIAPLVSVDWLEQQSRFTPIVMVGRHDRTDAYDTVTSDDVAGTRMMMRHLFERGHRRIAHLTTRAEVTAVDTGSPHGERLREYVRLMDEAGLADEVRIARIGIHDGDAYDRSAELIASTPRPSAIFAGSDFLALEALRAAADAGVDRDEVAIAGYDGIPFADHPGLSLTTVDQGGADLGARAARLLLERLAGRREASHVQTSPRLVVRRSTAPATPVADSRA